MAFPLPPAPRRYSQDNENQTRRILENTFGEFFARLTKAEADIAAGVGPPVVGPTAGFTSIKTNLTLAFTDTSTPGDGTIDTWAWNFGDGQTSANQNPTHVYAAPGNFNVILTVTDTNEKSDAFSAVVSPTAVPVEGAILRVGINGDRPIGVGPNETTSDPDPFGVALYHPTPGGIVADLAAAETEDVLLVLNLSGSPNSFTNGTVFVMADWKAEIDKFRNISQLTAALNERRAIIFAIDEPQHQKYGSPSTLTPRMVNDMGLYIKGIWPGAIVLVWSDARFMAVDGWSNIDNVPVPPPTTGWSGIDYAVSVWNHQGFGSPDVFFPQEKAELAAVNLGQVPSVSYIDGGLKNQTMLGVAACWDILNNGSSSGVITGTVGGVAANGTFFNCGDPDINQEFRFYASPNWRRAMIDYLITDLDAPFTTGYAWAGTPGPASLSGPPFTTLQGRSDVIAAMRYMVQRGRQRTAWNGWRPIK